MLYLFLLLKSVSSFQAYFIPPNQNPPNIRQLLRLTSDNSSKVLFLFGGFGDTNIYYDDLWAFNLTSQIWVSLGPMTTNRPEARIQYGLFTDSVSSLVYLYGGEGVNGYLDDMWAFNEISWRWTQVQQTGDLPPAFTRFTQTTFRDSKGNLNYVICCGKGLYSAVSDIYR